MPNAQYRIGAPYHAVARHPEEQPYNRMHEDGLPQQLGFRGAFVLGVALYGYMTRALVAKTERVRPFVVRRRRVKSTIRRRQWPSIPPTILQRTAECWS